MSDPNLAQFPARDTANATVMESDFSYEAPDTSPDPDFNSFLADTISEIKEEYDPNDPNSVQSDEGDEPEAEAEDEGDVLAPVEAEDDEDEDPKLARGVSRLVARELAAKERESAANEAVKKLEGLRAELAGYKGVKSVQELTSIASNDPIGAIKQLGHDPETFIRLAMAQHMGDEAPPALKEFARDAAVKREIADLRKQVQDRDRASAAAEYFNSVKAGAREYVTTKLGKATPTLAALAGSDPDLVHDDIMEVIVRDSQSRAAQDPNGEPMTYEEAAKRVEARYARLAGSLGGPKKKVVAPQIGKKPVAKSPPQSKPAARPIAPWLQKEDSFEDGINAALREYDRVEAARKARR